MAASGDSYLERLRRYLAGRLAGDTDEDTRTYLTELRGFQEGNVVASDLLYFFRAFYRLVREEKQEASVWLTDTDDNRYEFADIMFSVTYNPWERQASIFLIPTGSRQDTGHGTRPLIFEGTISNLGDDDAVRLGIVGRGGLSVLSGLTPTHGRRLDEEGLENVMAIKDIDGDFIQEPVSISNADYPVASISLSGQTMIKSSLFGRAEYTEWELKSALRATNNDVEAAAKLLFSG